MLGYLKNSYLTNEKGFQNPGEVLFIQKIKELLSNNSGISYSYKIHNLYSILLELRSVIEDYNYGRTNGFILEDVRKEAMEIAKNDLVMSKKQKALYEMMTEEIRRGLSLDKNNNYAIANSDMDKISAMDSAIRNLENIYTRLDYLNDTLDLLKEAIQNNSGNDIILLTECVVSSNIILKRSISSSYLSVAHFFHLCGWDMKNNIIRDGSKDGFQVMILKMKNIIEKANANKTAICFYPAVCVGNAIRFAGLGYAAFFVFSSKGENRYSSFL